MTAEEWRPAVGFPGYLVSNLGQIASTRQSRTPRILRPARNSRGYLFVTLRLVNAQRSMSVHRLVADAWIGPKPAGMQTRHLNGDKDNNAASNLAIGTRRENELDREFHARNPFTVRPEFVSAEAAA